MNQKTEKSPLRILRIIIPITYAILFFFFRDKIGAFVFLSIGIAFSWVGLHIWFSNRKIRENGIKTRAKIIDFAEEKIKDIDRESHKYHFPIVQFTDQNGLQVTQKIESSANPKRIKKPMDIIYWKKDNEYEIIENNNFWNFYFPLIFISAGILSLGIGTAWIIKEF
nr:hypothetical protein [Allomuricauda sp.]